MKVLLKCKINTKKLGERWREGEWGEDGCVEAVGWGKNGLSGEKSRFKCIENPLKTAS